MLTAKKEYIYLPSHLINQKTDGNKTLASRFKIPQTQFYTRAVNIS